MLQGPILSWQKEDGLSGTQQVFYASDFHNSVLIKKNIAQCLMLIRNPEWGEAGAGLLCEQIAVAPSVFVQRKAVICRQACGHWQAAMGSVRCALGSKGRLPSAGCKAS